MAFGKLGARGGFGSLGVLGGVGASAFADGQAAPVGYHWDFVTYNGERATYNGVPVVALVANGS